MGDSTDMEERAREAAEAWLSRIDRGDAAGAWEEAATGFRRAVTPEKWAASLAQVQGSVGKPVERAFESAEHQKELPGAPDGDYVILQYATRFERKARGRETVVPQLDVDGVWRVSGYWVK